MSTKSVTFSFLYPILHTVVYLSWLSRRVIFQVIITSLVQKMKVRLHLKSPLRKRGVERFKLKTENYFPDGEFDMD